MGAGLQISKKHKQLSTTMTEMMHSKRSFDDMDCDNCKEETHNPKRRLYMEQHSIVELAFSITNDRKYQYENPMEGDDFYDVCHMSLDNGDSQVTWRQFLEVWNTTEFDLFRRTMVLQNVQVIVHEGACNNNCILGMFADVYTNSVGDYWMAIMFKPILDE